MRKNRKWRGGNMPKMLGTYHTYNFKDKDPLIDYIRTVIFEYGKSIKAISDESGVGATTIANWLYGDTKRPQAAPLNAVLRACHYKLHITKMDAPELVYPTAFQPKPVKPRAFKPTAYKPTSIKPGDDKPVPKWKTYKNERRAKRKAK